MISKIMQRIKILMRNNIKKIMVFLLVVFCCYHYNNLYTEIRNLEKVSNNVINNIINEKNDYILSDLLVLNKNDDQFDYAQLAEFLINKGQPEDQKRDEYAQFLIDKVKSQANERYDYQINKLFEEDQKLKKENQKYKTQRVIYDGFAYMNILDSKLKEDQNFQVDIKKIQKYKESSSKNKFITVLKNNQLFSNVYYLRLNSNYLATSSIIKLECFSDNCNKQIQKLIDSKSIFESNKIATVIDYSIIAKRVFYPLVVATSFVIKNITLFFWGALLIISLIQLAPMLGLSMWNANKVSLLYPNDIKGNINDLVGMNDIKSELEQELMFLKHRNEFLKTGKKRASNIMLSGPAGTGKTRIASYLAKELNMPILYTSASNMETGWVGGGNGTLRSLYNQAKKLKKCIIFIDEAETLLHRRVQTAHHNNNDTINTFLSLLDGTETTMNEETEQLDIIWVVASNFNNANMEMDEAAMRRFGCKIDFRLPNQFERKEIYNIYLDKVDSSLKDNIDLDYIANISNNLSPAIIQSIVEKASTMAIQHNLKNEQKIKIDTNLLYKAFEFITIGLTNKETTENLEEQRNIITIHELGHFIVKFDLLYSKYNNLKDVKDKIDVLKISTEAISKYNALGFVLSKKNEDLLFSRKKLEESVMCLYGGVAAEEVYFGEDNITTGSFNDIKEATEKLKLMVSSLNMYSKSKINMESININSSEELKKKSKELYEETINIINKNKKLLDHLIPILTKRYVLTIDEILEEIAQFINKSE